MSKDKKKLLFVCLGNICRSPAAEAVMKAIVKREGQEKQYDIDSAGIGNWHVGDLPDSRMRRHGAKRGYQLDSRARQFQPTDFDKFDKILVMDHDNYRIITAKAANDAQRQKVEMLAQYLTHHPETDVIPDPYYGGDQDFEYALDLVEEACEQLWNKLQETGR